MEKAEREVIIGPGVREVLPQLGITEDQVRQVVRSPIAEEFINRERTRCCMEGEPIPGKRVVVECHIETDKNRWHLVYAFER